MNVRLGRNDPCHCGSGKKYKRCHLDADQAQERELAAMVAAQAANDAVPPPLPPLRSEPAPLPVLPPSPPPPQLTPEEEAMEALWERFEQATPEERPALFEAALAEPAFDPEYAFEMLVTMRDDSPGEDRRRRFRGLAERFQEQRPEVYEQDPVWVLSWLIEDAIVTGELDGVPVLLAPLADVAEKSISEVFRLIDALMFHDQVEPLIDMMTRAWPRVSGSPEILDRAVVEFAVTLTMLHLYRHLDRGGTARADDPELRAALEPLGVLDDTRVQAALDALSGAVRDWQPDDFLHVHDDEEDEHDDGVNDEDEQDKDDWDWNLVEDEDPDDLEDDAMLAPLLRRREPAAEEESLDGRQRVVDALAEQGDVDRRLAGNLLQLVLEWAGTVHQEQGVPLSRVEVMRDTLISIYMDRPTDKAGRVPLLPDRTLVEPRLITLMSVMSGQYYEAATLFALLPSYIDFLSARGLVKRDPARRARADILSLRPHVLGLLERFEPDPVLIEAVRTAGT